MRMLYIIFYHHSKELHPTFQVDAIRFTLAQDDKRTPGLFKEEETTDKIIC
jgi:hypothetical protein